VSNEQMLRASLLQSEGPLQIREYIEAAKRRKWAIILPTLGFCTLAAVIAYKMANTYKAETVIMVDPQQVPSIYVTPTVSSSISDRLSTIQQQVLSPSRVQKLIDTLNLYPELRGVRSKEDVVRKVQNSILVDNAASGGSHLSTFRISYVGKHPEEVAHVANQLATMFIDENMKAREDQSVGTAEFLDHELEQTKAELERKDKEVQAVKARNIMELPDSKQYHIEVLGNLRAQLQSSQDRVNQDQQQKVYVQSLMASSHPTVDLDSNDQTSGASPQEIEIQKLESRLAELETRYGPNHPDVRRARKDLEDLRKKAEAQASKVRKQPPVQVESLASNANKNPVLESQLNKLNQEIEGQTKLQAQLQEQINFHTSKLEQIPIFEQQIAGLMRDYESLRAHYTSLLDKKLSAQMASALETRQKAERFVILDLAVPPNHPFSPNRPLICLAGLFGGLLGGIGLATVLEMGDEALRSEAEAARISGKPVLAGIPRLFSSREIRRRQLQIASAMVGTVICSAAIGLLVARVISQLS